MTLISTDFLARMRRLNLPVRRTLPGFSHGPHRGQIRGAGLEFSEYRRYEPGDDLRRLDWKLAARSDRYFVREAERDSQVPVWLLLDVSASMLAPAGATAAGMTASTGKSMLGWQKSATPYRKVDFGAAVLAAIAMMAARQGDAVGLALLSDSTPQLLPARRGQRELQRLIATLTRVQCDGRLPLPSQARALASVMRTRAVCVMVSDFIDDGSLTWLRWLQVTGHDVAAIALDNREERELPFAGAAMLEGYEGEPALAFSPAQRSSYLQARQQQREQWARWCRQHQVQWQEAAIEQAPDQVVQHFLRARAPGGSAWS
ncbi:DUF58 domain-containing protein [Permianibacter sp. IMCC34836]|uniref:DUF58 domain-containing protein n=1 Tax=Permianibacter fluminis TaxID=2738515 RepID=UPI0015547BA0|nr:DUF58 domain-containing protein [Permianibacter fluminis]NQD38560.1 DUF58 domain-containing protein [Permianibacter fluminis]